MLDFCDVIISECNFCHCYTQLESQESQIEHVNEACGLERAIYNTIRSSGIIVHQRTPPFHLFYLKFSFAPAESKLQKPSSQTPFTTPRKGSPSICIDSYLAYKTLLSNVCSTESVRRAGKTKASRIKFSSLTFEQPVPNFRKGTWVLWKIARNPGYLPVYITSDPEWRRGSWWYTVENREIGLPAREVNEIELAFSP